ncbi:MAG TPA: cupin domain-containing protein [Myxococcaceae bacterium]|nr:cupin domain-containing protein [Myxococcaceae bacterium]
MDAKALSAFTQFSDEKLKKHNLFQTGRFFLDVYCLRPGQSQKPHAHEGSDKVYVVLEGTCRFRVDADEQLHGAGVAVFAPAGSEHGVENPGPQDARLLVMMAPAPPSPSK